MLIAVAAPILMAALMTAPVRVFQPPTSAFILLERATGGSRIVHQNVDIEHVSRYLLAAVVFNEDVHFASRNAPFELDVFIGRVEHWAKQEGDPSGSTIQQQLAKNLYLWPGGGRWWGPFRKALEALLAWGLHLSVDRRELLEAYVNVAEFGPGIYGVCAASWYYYGHGPHYMPLERAVELVGLLPAPSHVGRGPYGGVVRSVDGSDVTERAIAYAERRLPPLLSQPDRFDRVRLLGIEGDAEEAPGNPRSCSEMPESVRLRITQEQVGLGR